MPSNTYAGYVPRPPRPMYSGDMGPSKMPQPDVAGAQAMFRQVNPQVFQQGPQVTSTFGGRPVTMNAPPMAAGSMYNGGRVMAGLGGGPGRPSPSPTASNGPTRNAWAGWVGQGGAAQPAGGQPTAAAGNPAMGGIPAQGGPAGGLTGLPLQAQQQLDAANKANKDRYNTLLGNEQQDKQELLTAMNGWNPLITQAQQDRTGVLNNMNSGWDAVLGLAGQNGIQSDLEREQRRKQSELGANAQSLVNRGLTNTTITDTSRRGIVDDSALREQGIHDQQRQREIAARQNMLAQTVPTQMQLNSNVQNLGTSQLQQLIPALMDMNRQRQGIIERRSDEGPNLALISQLLQQQGATQQSNNSIAQALQAAQAGAGAQYQSLLNSILGQMPGGGGGYGRQPGQVRNGPGNNSGNRGGFGLRRPGGFEQHTGAQNVNGGGYNSNPGHNYPPPVRDLNPDDWFIDPATANLDPSEIGGAGGATGGGGAAGYQPPPMSWDAYQNNRPGQYDGGEFGMNGPQYDPTREQGSMLPPTMVPNPYWTQGDDPNNRMIPADWLNGG